LLPEALLEGSHAAVIAGKQSLLGGVIEEGVAQ
jgi:hypothetical protein